MTVPNNILFPGQNATMLALRSWLAATEASGGNSVRMQNATGNGTTNDRPAVVAADAQGPVTFPSGAYLIGSNLTITNNVRFEPGAYIVVPNGVTVTFGGEVDAGPDHIFALTGTGGVAFTRPLQGYAEWWGAKRNDASVDSTSALNRAMASLATTLLLPGTYYTNTEIRLTRNYSALIGAGRDISVISCSSTTAHILVVQGPTSSSYVERPVLRGFSLSRSLSAATPSNRANDLIQGHGLHMQRASNPVIEQVNSLGSLMDFYWKDTLSGYANDLFSQMKNGGSSDRRYSFYLDGTNTGTPPPFDSFPSPNPVFRLFNIRQANSSFAGETHGLYLLSARTDLRIDGCETASCHFSVTLEGSGSNVWLQNFWLDAFKHYGLRILDSDVQSRTNVMDFYGTPAAGASGQTIFLDGAHSVVVTGEVASPPGVSDSRSGVLCKNSVRCDINLAVVNHNIGVELDTCFGMAVKCRFAKFNGSAASAIKVTRGNANTLVPTMIGVAGGVSVNHAIDANATGLNTYDVTGVLASAVSFKIRQDGNTITTQGNVGNNVIINPGAGAML